jgi:hypothetical protein
LSISLFSAFLIALWREIKLCNENMVKISCFFIFCIIHAINKLLFEERDRLKNLLGFSYIAESIVLRRQELISGVASEAPKHEPRHLVHRLNFLHISFCYGFVAHKYFFLSSSYVKCYEEKKIIARHLFFDRA